MPLYKDKVSSIDRTSTRVLSSSLPASVSFVGKKEDDKAYPYTVPIQPKNYFLKVCENKDVGKLVSVLSSAINSMKKVSFIRTSDERVFIFALYWTNESVIN